MLPKGIRNNNPFNLVKSSSQWMGKLAKGTDSRFEQFSSMELGVRAGLINLRNGYFRKGLITPNGIVNKYAPEFENKNNLNYKLHIAQSVGSFDINVDLTGKELTAAGAIMSFENGYSPLKPYQIHEINQRYKIF